MSGTSDPSNHEMLDRLTAELRCLRPDVREQEFKTWRAEVSAAMSELFGPGHRMTVALRDVNFSPRFEQGRTRAMALLRAASSLVASAPSETPAAAAPEPAPGSDPDETVEAVSEPPVAPEPVADPVTGPPVAAEPVADPTVTVVEPVKPTAEPIDGAAEAEPVEAEPADESPPATSRTAMSPPPKNRPTKSPSTKSRPRRSNGRI